MPISHFSTLGGTSPRTTARRPRRDPFTEPPSGVRRQPLLRGAVQDPEVPPRLPWPLPRLHRRDRLLPNVLPLVQHRTSPWRDRDAHPGRRASQSNPERAGAARADPSSRLDPSSRTLRSRDPTTGSPSPSRLDQPTCDTHNRRNCSVNRNRHCLKVVDRFRGGMTEIRRNGGTGERNRRRGCCPPTLS